MRQPVEMKKVDESFLRALQQRWLSSSASDTRIGNELSARRGGAPRTVMRLPAEPFSLIRPVRGIRNA
jgi:hypothetical protein